MKSELFTVIRDGLKIHGIAYMSDKTAKIDDFGIDNCKKTPAVILSHGFLANYTGFEGFAKLFSEYGFSVFCYNFCGGSSNDAFEYKSDGDSRDMCISSEIEDLCAVFEYVKNQPYVDVENIYLLGESQGAFVSGLAAARLKEQVKKLIMIYPAVCIPDHARRGALGGANYDPKNPPLEMVLPMTTLGKTFHDDVKDMDAYSELAKYKGEVLLIQGTDDDIVVPQYQYIVKDMFDRTDSSNNHRCHLQVISGMEHMVSDVYRKSIFDSIRQFIEGKKEILTFRIIITKVKEVDKTIVKAECETETQVFDGVEYKIDDLHYQDVEFTGYCESPIFTGTITSGVDHQVYFGEECLQMLAEYTFAGVDTDGNYCELSVCNKKGGKDWKPVINTTSEKLSWLNDADLTAVVESGKLGPTIRIYY